MDFHVSLVGRRDLSGEIYRQLRGAIVDGRFHAGESLPATRELARSLSVSRTTVTVAYDRLAGEGFVTGRVGAGTFVSAHVGPAPKPRRAGGGEALGAIGFWSSIPLSNAFERSARFDFRSGLPDASLFPHALWRRLVGRELRNEAVAGGVYGHPAGYLPLRELIVHRLGIARAVEATADDVTITSGTQQALDVIARVLLTPGDRVAVEDPGYLPAVHVFRAAGARVIGVPVDEQGIVVEAIPRNVRLLYVTPSHQYPLGVPLSLPRRVALLEWAAHSGAAIIEDDYDAEFRFGGRPIEPLQTLDDAGRVIYIGSFSKTMLPTLRLGFIVAPASIRDAIHRAKYVTDWHTSMLGQAALARFIETGAFGRHVKKMSGVYRTRHQLISETLRRDFADELELVPSEAGLHLAALARKASVAGIKEILRRAMDAGVAFQALARFAIDGPPRAGIILGYGAIPTHLVRAGLRRLRECFR